jgi:hypothetical protein
MTQIVIIHIKLEVATPPTVDAHCAYNSGAEVILHLLVPVQNVAVGTLHIRPFVIR